MAQDKDLLAKHAESRRAFLAKTAVTSPAVSLLLAQAARPARAQTYGGGGATTTAFSTIVFTEPETSAPTSVVLTNPTSILLTQPTSILLTNPTSILITQPTTVILTNPTTIRIT
jgi:hypothetical protein